MIRRSLGICCLLAGVCCSNATESSQPVAIEDFVCERSYINFASGYQHHGIYVDAQGHVFAFGSESLDTSAQEWRPPRPDAPTRQELEERYSRNQRQVGTVDAQKLVEVHRWLAIARQGSMSKKVQRGADMGSNMSTCLVRDIGTDRYREIELAVDGDWSYKNTTPAAEELVRWLAALAPLAAGVGSLSVVRLLQPLQVELAHLEHGVHGALRLRRVLVAQHPAQ